MTEFAPCPTCGQYNHSIGDDELAGAFRHFEAMSSHRGDGKPTQFNFDEKTRDAAQVLMAAARPSPPEAGELIERLRSDDPADYAAKWVELLGWTGSAFLAGEKLSKSANAEYKAELYGFLCELLDYLVVAEQTATAAREAADLIESLSRSSRQEYARGIEDAASEVERKFKGTLLVYQIAKTIRALNSSAPAETAGEGEEPYSHDPNKRCFMCVDAEEQCRACYTGDDSYRPSTPPAHDGEVERDLGIIADLTRKLWAEPHIVRARNIDIIARKDGVEKRYEADWIKLFIKLVPQLRAALASRGAPVSEDVALGADHISVTRAALAILKADDTDLLSADGYPEEAAEKFAQAALAALSPSPAVGEDK